MTKVKNEMVEVPKTKDMNDENYLNDILSDEKNMSNNYSLALNEMSNNKLFKEIYDLFNDSKSLAREAFELAFKNGWYELTKASESDITTTYDKNSKKLKEL